MTVLERLEKVRAAIVPLGYAVEVDEAESAVLIRMTLHDRQRIPDKPTGPVLQAARSAGIHLTGARASSLGMTLLVGEEI